MNKRNARTVAGLMAVAGIVYFTDRHARNRVQYVVRSAHRSLTMAMARYGLIRAHKGSEQILASFSRYATAFGDDRKVYTVMGATGTDVDTAEFRRLLEQIPGRRFAFTDYRRTSTGALPNTPPPPESTVTMTIPPVPVTTVSPTTTPTTSTIPSKPSLLRCDQHIDCCD